MPVAESNRKRTRHPAERLWPKVNVGHSSDCWEWTGAKNSSGYGHLGMPGNKTVLAHRLAFALVNRVAIELLPIMRHRCDNPLCCNPQHLEPGSISDNTRDAIERGQIKVGEHNCQAKLSDAQVHAIRADSRTHDQIARDYGVARRTIGKIKQGISRRHT